MRAIRKVIRYSHAFKMQMVREVEEGPNTTAAVARKYGIGHRASVMRWVRQYGSGRYGKVIRVERPEEVNELNRLRQELRRVKEALADAHMELALEQAYLSEACEQLQQSVESFKKKRVGRRLTGRPKRTLN